MSELKKRIIFATTNEGKMKEIRMLFSDMNYTVVSLAEASLHPEIVENGSSFEENAMIKANTIAQLTGEIALADDSGLEIDYLDKAPGIYSARFLGEDTSYDYKNQFILEKLLGVPEDERTARFVCAIALSIPNGKCITRRATIEGKIAHHAAGENGFGYDPIFYVPEFFCTTAEMTAEQKNQISHRAKALQAIKDEIRGLE